jgi:enterochelin esterase-like enzyme
MNNTQRLNVAASLAVWTSLTLALAAFAQPAAAPSAQPGRGMGAGRGPQGPQVVSPEVQADGHVTFRILAPQAERVTLSAGDIPGSNQGGTMTKGTNGVWEVTLGPIDPGAYRYNFNVNGVSVIDPRSPAFSQSNNNLWSMVYVPGADFMDTKEVPHGAVASVTYYSTALQRFRRMHIYTPPGYELGKGKYPTFYLLHGAGDSDDSWTSVGRAGFILDNLIAAGKAKPMVVVMPAGHTRATGGFGARGGAGAGGQPPVDEFTQDFLTDIMPYVEKNYRVEKDRRHRAIAGLSMGGSQTLNIAIPHLEKFAYIGVYSSGLIGSFGGRGGAATAPSGPTWEERHLAVLDDAKLKKGLALLWFSTGKEDFLLNTTTSTVEMFKKHGFSPVYHESAGGHTWINWRNYLREFAPQLFQ